MYYSKITGSDERLRASLPVAYVDSKGADAGGAPRADVALTVVIVESNLFLRECLHRSVGSGASFTVLACSSLADLLQADFDSRSMVVLLSTVSLTREEADAEFATLAALEPLPRCIVLAKTDSPEEALRALNRGANGFISMSSSFDIFIEAIKFVGAGGTYVPAQCLLAARQTAAPADNTAAKSGLTTRELSVVQAIRQGKPNKVIAYELNMCESTVKVHVRHVMKKLHARNRTEVAVKGAQIGAA